MIFVAILIGILILGILVFVHEAGHFIAAKIFGVKVEEFGFGFPPRIWGKRKGETTYSINAIPAGGFVNLLGEVGDQGPRSFAAKPSWIRALIVSAGVIVNLLLAVIIFTILLWFTSFKTNFNLIVDNKFPFGNQENFILIAKVDPGSPAEKAGIEPGDKIVLANGQRFDSIASFKEFIDSSLGSKITLKLDNAVTNEEKEVSVVPRVHPPAGQGSLGVVFAGRGLVATVSYRSLPEKVFSGFLHAGNMLQYQFVVIGSLVSRSIEEGTPEPVAEQVSGPIGIVALISVIVGAGGIAAIESLVTVIALLSLVLAVVNILPIPALDGGRLAFIVVEAITRRKVNPAIERAIHLVGFIVIIVLFLLVSYNDIIKIFG